jgi:hypothetical protein
MSEQLHIKVCEDADGEDIFLRVFTEEDFVVISIVSEQGGRQVKLEPHTAYDVGDHIKHIAASAAVQRIIAEDGSIPLAIAERIMSGE